MIAIWRQMQGNQMNKARALPVCRSRNPASVHMDAVRAYPSLLRFSLKLRPETNHLVDGYRKSFLFFVRLPRARWRKYDFCVSGAFAVPRKAKSQVDQDPRRNYYCRTPRSSADAF